MPPNSPVNQGIIQAQIEFNREPPITPYPRVDQDLYFNSKSGGFNALIFNKDNNESRFKNEDTSGTIEALPEKKGLYGLVLRSRERILNDNLIGDPNEIPDDDEIKRLRGEDLSNSDIRRRYFSKNILRDDNGIVNDIIGENKTEDNIRFVNSFFSQWKIIKPFYSEFAIFDANEVNGYISAENVSTPNGEPLTPLRISEYNISKVNSESEESEEQTNGNDLFPDQSGLSTVQKARLNGAKWQYVRKSVPRHDTGLTGSSIDLEDDDKTSLLVPHQVQKQGNTNGPTGIGVHWGISKFTKLPNRQGFYLTFFLDKTLDSITNSELDPTEMPPITDHSGVYKDYFSTEPPSNSNSGIKNNIDKKIDNNDIFFVSEEDNQTDETNFFNLLNTSYLLIAIERDSSVGDAYYILIRADDSPKCWNINTTERKITFLGEFSGVNGSYLLTAGGVNELKMRFRNFSNHMIIDTNLNIGSWVITKQPYKSRGETGSFGADEEARLNLLTLGGGIKVFGGNLTAGVHYSDLNFVKEDSLDIVPFTVLGKDREIGATFATFGASEMPSELRTKTNTFEQDKNSDFYFVSAGKLKNIDKESSSSRRGSLNKIITLQEVDLSERIDVKLGRYGSYSKPDAINLNISNNVSDEKMHKLIILNENIDNDNDEEADDDDDSPFAKNVLSNVITTSVSTEIKMKAGNVFYIYNAEILGERLSFAFDAGPTMSPVLYYLRRFSPLKDFDRGDFKKIDVTNIVTNLSISWEAEDIHAISQNGNITFNIYRPKDNRESNEAAQEIIDSIGKNRYVRIRAKLSNSELNKSTFPESSSLSYTLFTGIMTNAQLDEQPGSRLISFELKDYWTILKSNIIMNSPYFDGALDTTVIDYMLSHTGIDTDDKSKVFLTPSRDVLPISFSFDDPIAKYEDKRSIDEIIKELAKKYHKVAFFDEFGRFQYVPVEPFIINVGNIDESIFTSKHQFYSSHLNKNRNIQTIGKTFLDSDADDVPNDNNQIAYLDRNVSWRQDDIINVIQILSVDARSKGLITVTDTNIDSLVDEDSYGFLGYKKPFIQEEASFGSPERVQSVVRYYSRMYQPIYSIKWKTFGGLSNLKPLDLVSIDRMFVVIQNIQQSFEPSENKWETSYEGEWIWPPKNSVDLKKILENKEDDDSTN